MFEWLKQHWLKVVWFMLFLGCVAGFAWAITLKSPIFIVTMLVMSGIFGLAVYWDYKRVSAQNQQK